MDQMPLRTGHCLMRWSISHPVHHGYRFTMVAVVKYCQSKGVLVLTAGTYSNVIRFLPPLVITDELLKDALNVLEEGFASL